MLAAVEIILSGLARPFRGKRTRIAVDLPSEGELQFIYPVLDALARRNAGAEYIIVHHTPPSVAARHAFDHLQGRVIHASNTTARLLPVRIADLFITSEQYSLGLGNTYSICIFHGQPSKGLTFTDRIIESFDAFFLYGPLHLEAYMHYIADPGNSPSSRPELFNVGYPKSDGLLNGRYPRTMIRERLGISPDQTAILYAPAFNEGASLREQGPEIIEELCRLPDCAVIVKLPIDCWQPTSNTYATGGIDWFATISALAKKHPNLVFYKDYEIDPLLACSDILVTCVSSVSFEFLALNKPVIFIDTPAFYSGFLKRRFPHADTGSWSVLTTVNAGREFGPIVKNAAELPAAIERVLREPGAHPFHQDKLKDYLLYNRGHAAEAAAIQIETLLAGKPTTGRPWFRAWLVRLLRHAFVKPLRSLVNVR